jgi:hypothetical protein
MCWSANVSILTFLIGFVVSYTLIKRNRPFDKTLAILIFTYSLVQFGEFLIWKSMEGEKYGFNTSRELNSFATKLIYINLYAHALAIGYGIYSETGQILPMKLGLFIFLYGLITMPTIKGSTVTDHGHLLWDFDNRFYVIVFLLAMWSIYKYTDLRYTKVAVLFYVATYIVSYSFRGNGSASYWCWISALLSFYPLLSG